MSENTNATVARVLAENPDGVTARKLAGLTRIALPTVTNALTAMEASGTAVRTEGGTVGGRKTADTWTAATPTPDTADNSNASPVTEPDDADDATTTEPAENAADAGDAAPVLATLDDAEDAATDGHASDTGTATANESTVDTPETEDGNPSDAPVPAGVPASTPDLKVIMVAGVLGDHPDGVSAADVVEHSGLRAAVVGRALAAMEAAGAAARKTADADGVELWIRGDTDPATVSLVGAPTYVECPTCGHRKRVTTSVGTRRVSTAPGTNGDGQRTLRKGELRAMVIDFINRHPGHEFTAGDIARELGRSPGAVINNLDYLLGQGLVAYADADGKKVTALATAADS